MRFFSFVLLISLSVISCSNDDNNIEKLNDPELFHQAMQNLTDVIVYDIFSPPVASRIYVYPSIAAYENLIDLLADKLMD